jgi:hypothetical protein
MTDIVLLFHRLVLFAVFQGLIALGYAAGGNTQAWQASIAWWPLCAALTGLVSLLWQRALLRRDGRRWRDLVALEPGRRGREALLALGAMLIGAPLALIPNIVLGALLFGRAEATQALMFRPLPGWAAAVQLIAFPLFIALSELPVYFAIAMPRLRPSLGRVGAWLVASLFLALQHISLPLIFDGRFMLWRALMFAPFALWTGFVIDRRPGLLPYLMAAHFLLDLATAALVAQAH